MMKATTCVLLFSIYIALCAGVCPPDKPCTTDLKLPSCKSVSFFIHKGEVCQTCDLCVKKSNNLTDGCPLRACKRIKIPDECRREIYYVYQGGRICKDCPRDACRFSRP